MEKVNLLKELRQEPNGFESKFDALRAAQAILDKSSNQDSAAKVAAVFGIPEPDQKVLKMQAQIAENDKLVTENQIKAMCAKYDLKFLSPGDYKQKHTIPADCGDAIEAFTKQYDKPVYSANWYLLAPREHFVVTTKYVYDPILFYYLGGDMYQVVHKWGDDFTVARKVRGFLRLHMRFIIAFVFIFALVLNIIYAFNKPYFESEAWTGLTVAAITFFGGMFMIELILNTESAQQYREHWRNNVVKTKRK